MPHTPPDRRLEAPVRHRGRPARLRPRGVQRNGPLTRNRGLSDVMAAGVVAAALSGIPSTMHALLTGADPLEASRAAGSLLLPDEQRPVRLLGAAGLVHGSISLGWALILAAALPSRRTALTGGLAGVGIAALDLGLVGRRFPPIRRLPVPPQLADHVAYGATVGAVLAWRRRRHGGNPSAGEGKAARVLRRHERAPCVRGGEPDIPGADVIAVRALPAAPAQVFKFLSDLNNHWLLEDRFVELGGLDEPERDGPRGGRVRLNLEIS